MKRIVLSLFYILTIVCSIFVMIPTMQVSASTQLTSSQVGIYEESPVSYDTTIQDKVNGHVVASSSKQKLQYGDEFTVNFDLENAQDIYIYIYIAEI